MLVIIFVVLFILWFPVAFISWVLGWLSSMADDAEEILSKCLNEGSESISKSMEKKEAE